MPRLSLALAATCVALASAAPSGLYKTAQQMVAQARRNAGASASPGDVMRHLLKDSHTYFTSLQAQAERQARMQSGNKKHIPTIQNSVYDTVSHSYYPANGSFYGIVPEFIGAPTPAKPFGWSSTCLTSNMATLSTISNGAVTFNITSSGLNTSAPGCTDFYLIGTVDYLDLIEVSQAGSQAVTVPVNRTTWVQREGVRVFRFIHDPLTTIGDAVSTISLFVPSLTEATLDPQSQQANLAFLRDFVGLTYETRSVDLIDMDWSIVQSGDLLTISRLDGLGTMEQWGTGAATSHIVIALRLGPDQRLYIAESTAKDAYWPLDNIQLNAIETWVPMAQASKYAVVHVPLSDAARAVFNQSAAENFIFNSVGLPYGYHNFIATFFDSETGNLPWPASWQFVEVVFNLLESIDSALTDQLLGESLNMRLGTTGLTLAQAADAAATRNLTMGGLIAVVESDDWVYSDGPSMVCDVFYCETQKQAGVFKALFGIEDDQLNCREFHNLDVYRLAIFNTTFTRPQVCIDADPDLPYCQIMGQYRLALPNVNTMTPYAHMNERCGALPLDYTRFPENC